MKLVLVGNTYKVDKLLLEKVAKAAFSFLKQSAQDGYIELRFVSEQTIIKLNGEYRSKNTKTDVLSFEISKTPLIGQVFICYNVLKAQATELGNTLSEEAALLLVHGILHVSGIDHLDDAEAMAMEAAEKKILIQVGVKR